MKIISKKTKKSSEENSVEKVKYENFNSGEGNFKTLFSKKYLARKPYSPVNPKFVYSAIPGTITDILVEVGEDVDENSVLLVLEAMKMQNKITAPINGKVKKIDVKKGDKIPKNFLMIEFE
ncbi:MAG: acetyl-CoA carboxylase biotin carboxyl carrier protein subunit [Bacteroidales bacterium]|jgi:biotin carboxyl carrier protein|nr:acetyl-CoA carboxylase biotin carboxyl carrier protein subunit [Bacteroidales bacterium]